MRVVVDTNVLVSLLLERSSTATLIRQAFLDERFVLLYSVPLIEELEEVTVRPKLAKFIGPRERTEFLALLLSLGELVEVTEPFPDAGDPGDDFLLAMLRDGEADLLVSGDKRVLELAEFEGAAIRSMREFADSLST